MVPCCFCHDRLVVCVWLALFFLSLSDAQAGEREDVDVCESDQPMLQVCYDDVCVYSAHAQMLCYCYGAGHVLGRV